MLLSRLLLKMSIPILTLITYRAVLCLRDGQIVDKMKFGYARVSTAEQNLDIQIEKLKEAGCDEIYQEKASGANDGANS